VFVQLARTRNLEGIYSNVAGEKFRRLEKSSKMRDFSILKEFIQKKSIGRQKTRACRFSVLLRILAMLRRLDWYQQGHCRLHWV